MKAEIITHIMYCYSSYFFLQHIYTLVVEQNLLLFHLFDSFFSDPGGVHNHEICEIIF